MLVLGIDPSTASTGWALVEAEGAMIRVVESGTISPKAEDLPARLLEVYEFVDGILEKYPVDAVSCEGQFMGKNAQTLAALSCVRGVVMLASEKRGVPVYIYPPSRIKLLVAGKGNAGKKEVMASVAAATGFAASTYDESDAIAAVLAHIMEHKGVNSICHTIPKKKSTRSSQGSRQETKKRGSRSSKRSSRI